MALYTDLYWFNSIEVEFTKRSIILETLAWSKIASSVVLRILSAVWNSSEKLQGFGMEGRIQWGN